MLACHCALVLAVGWVAADAAPALMPAAASAVAARTPRHRMILLTNSSKPQGPHQAAASSIPWRPILRAQRS